jgi:gliding motility-associated-like protein
MNYLFTIKMMLSGYKTVIISNKIERSIKFAKFGLNKINQNQIFIIMKKIIFVFIFLSSFFSYSQLALEGFEGSSTSLPLGWNKYSELSGIQDFKILNSALVCQGANAAVINRENMGLNASSVDYLVTPQFAVPANGQLRFTSKQTFPENNGLSAYKIKISTNADPSILTAYTTLPSGTYTEDEMNLPYNECKEQKLDIPLSYVGQQVYIAFVREVTQTNTLTAGDRWLLDEISVVSKCLPSSGLGTINPSVNSATLQWTTPVGATSWQLVYTASGSGVVITEILTLGTTAGLTLPNPPGTLVSYNLTGLQPNTAYEFSISTVCGPNNTSNPVGPVIFITLASGTQCTGAIPVTTLPYTNTNNTGLFADLVDVAQGAGCGALPVGTNYMAGNEVFYTYTNTGATSELISIKSTPVAGVNNSSLFVYGACPVGGACLAGVANNNSQVRLINNFQVNAGQTIYIVISSAVATQTVGYTLVIQKETCTPPVNAAITEVDLDSAKLEWTNPTAATSWEVSVQLLNTGIPTVASTTVVTTTSNPYATPNNLTPGTQYEYYVRSECAPGIFSSWSGPYPFNTVICEEGNKCNYTFRMTDSANNGWQGAKMQVRQNGIVVGEIGPTYTTGAGPIDVVIGLCNNVPFDLFWSVAGTAPAQCKVAIINSFGQTLYTKAAGQSSVGQVVYTGQVDCINPVCTIPPINVVITSTSITTTGATVTWVAPATSSWDVLVLPFGSPNPNSGVVTTPIQFLDNITASGTNPNFSFTIIGLTQDTPYDVYVRVNCLPTDSQWNSIVASFTTLPTCVKPSALGVNGITQTSATFNWTNGTASDISWEILLVKTDIQTPPSNLPLPLVNPILNTGSLLIPISSPISSPYTVSTLTPATIYYYYIRTVCPGDDKSNWSGPIVFNTITCDPLTKCNYKFLLTNSSGNTWNGGRMLVRQNGILIQTLGANSINATAGVSVGICPDEPYDLFWSIAGTVPENIGLRIISPFTDIIYTKLPGQGVPLTVLYSNTLENNCTPPTCPKPVPLPVVATTIGTTAAQLTWTEQSSALQWEVFVTPFGSDPPVNGSPLIGTSSGVTFGNGIYYLADSNPFTVTGLLPATIYQYYIRALCSATDRSTWTILNPIRFITKPINDECAGAINVPVNPTRICTNFAVGNTLGATRSLPNTLPVCAGNTDDDVWFTFIATNTIHIININNIIDTTIDMNHTLYSGLDCNLLTQLYCSNPNTSIANNLTIGNVYKIRVYTNAATAVPTATFEVCITTPPTVLNENCLTATPAPVNNGLICTLTTPGSLTGATASNQGGVTCPGTEDDDIWFSFVSNSATQIIDLINIQGTSIDLNHAVYSGNCNALVLKYCSDPDQSTANTFVVGQTYYIRVWSAVGTLQDITFDLCIGRILPPISANTTQYTKQQLIEDILLKTTCANVNNITFSTGTNFPATPAENYIPVNGIGYFNKEGSEFPFEEGIVLSTGNAASTPGPNGLLGLGEGGGGFPLIWTGDDELEEIILAGTGTAMNSNNATKLEFDFTPLANQISFNFLFASEEYGTFQCTFSDSFAFILTDLTTGIKTNLAVIPNTTIPVSVVKIRDNTHNNLCASENVAYFGDYYGTTGLNPLGAPINFNGLTVPLTATSAVVAGNPYHIKLVIADQGDSAFDSSVFLEGGSFDIGNVELGGDFLEANGNAICPGDSVIIDTELDPLLYNFNWFKDGAEIIGETGPTYTVTLPGVYKVVVQYLLSLTCIREDSKTIEFFQDITAGNATNLIDCDTVQTSIFDLTPNGISVLAPFVPGTHNLVGYFTSEADAIANTNAISTPNAFVNTINPQTIWVRVDKNGTGCSQRVPFTVSVQDLTPKFEFSGDTSICPLDSSLISVVPINNDFDITLVTYQWFLNNVALVGETNNSINISGSNLGSYSCTVTNVSCFASKAVEITNSNTVWVLDITNPTSICPDETGVISVNVTNNTSNSPVTYSYTLPDGTLSPVTTNTLNVDQTGTYTIEADILGCKTSQSITIQQSNTVWNLNITNPISLCPDENGVISVNVTNNTSNSPVIYSYTLPDGTLSPVTTNSLSIDAPGTYLVKVTILGCETTSLPIIIGESASNWMFSFVNQPYEICPLQSVTLSFTGDNFNISNPNALYKWTKPDGTTSLGTSLNANLLGSYSLEVDILGCKTSKQVQVVGNPKQAEVNFEFGCEGNNYKLRTLPVNNSFNPQSVNYVWSGPNFVAGSSSNEIIIKASGDYSVKIIDPDGCSTIKNIILDNISCIIQKGISPKGINGGDGNNDYFDLSTLNVTSLEIFNRYGLKTYSKDNYEKEWYGQSDDGNELPDGTYYYVIKLTDGDPKTGWIYINREQ